MTSGDDSPGALKAPVPRNAQLTLRQIQGAH
jgi:hypothetical protein